MKRPGITFTLLSTLSLPVAAGDHPNTVGPHDPDRGYAWYAASRVLTADGSVKAARLPRWLRKGLEWQVQRSSTEHGLEDGQVPPSREHCAPRLGFVTWPPGETGGDFASVLLLSEIAVHATLGARIPGFTQNGNPMVLFPLSDVVRLHGRSSSPDYVLVSFDRLVIRGRVFCAVSPSHAEVWGAEPPVRGDRVVLLGPWSSDGVMRARASHPASASLAKVTGDDELIWKPSLGVVFGGPRTLAGLQARVDEAVFGGLFDLTAHLHAQEWGSPERRRVRRNLAEAPRERLPSCRGCRTGWSRTGSSTQALFAPSRARSGRRRTG